MNPSLSVESWRPPRMAYLLPEHQRKASRLKKIAGTSSQPLAGEWTMPRERQGYIRQKKHDPL